MPFANASDPGWPALVEFLTEAGLSDGKLERALTALDQEDISTVGDLRCCLPAMKQQLSVAAYTLIGNKLAAEQSLPSSLPSGMEQAAASSLAVFNILIKFKAEEVTCRLALLADQYKALPLHGVLKQINVVAQQHLAGPYTIASLLNGGAELANDKSLYAQGVPPDACLAANVEMMNTVHAAAAGRPRPTSKVAAPPLPRKPNGHFTAKPPAPPPPPTAAAQMGSSGTHKGVQRGPVAGAPKKDKKTKPELWTASSTLVLADGTDVTPRMHKMAEAVEENFGKVAADGCGRGIWCAACALLQPLGKPFDLQAWRTHITRKKHGATAALRSKLRPATPKVIALEYGTSRWLAARQAQWRERRAELVAKRREGVAQ